MHESTKKKTNKLKCALWIRTRVVLLPMPLSNWLLLSESTAVEASCFNSFSLANRVKQQCNARRVYDICNETLVCVSRARCLQCSNDYNKIKTTSLFFHVYNFHVLCSVLCAQRMWMRVCVFVCEYDRERKTLTLHQLDDKKKIPSPTKRCTYTCAYTPYYTAQSCSVVAVSAASFAIELCLYV